MRRLLLLLCLLWACFYGNTQPYGNEWIDYTQTHYKIRVTADGLYRIPYSTLSAVIPNLSALNVNSFVMYHNGQEVPIYISAAGNLGANDYIEFYGRKNIGDIDSNLYANAALQQPHPFVSLFTDASTYFLTIRIAGNNKRFVVTPNNLSNPPAQDNYFIHTERQVYASRYYEGKYYTVGSGIAAEEVYKSTFEDGEGFVNNAFFGSVTNGNPQQVTQLNFNISTPYINLTGPAAVYRTVYVNNSFGEGHTVNINLNSGSAPISQTTNSGFKLHKITKTIPLSDLLSTGNNTFTFTEANTGNQSKKQNAVYMNELSYPRDFNFDGKNSFYFQLAADAANGRYIVINNFNDEGLQPVLYDITNGILIRSTQTPGTAPRFVLPHSTVTRELILVSGGPASYTTITQVTPVSFANYSAANIAQQGNYLIITQRSLNVADNNGTNWIEEYKNYRNGKYTARVYDIDQLYDQFAYGVSKSHLAIRNFIRYAVANYTQTPPTHVFLIGKGREYNVMRNNSTATNQCLIPTFGFPGSDNLYASTKGNDTPTIAIGRLAAVNTLQIRDYLAKIKEYETEQVTYVNTQPIPPKIWQKHILHFSGGTSSQEQNQFRIYLNNYANTIQKELWGAKVTPYSRTTSGPIDESLSQVIRGEIEEGVSLITFFGHSATGAFDFSIDEPENYTNKGKYPVILSNGCFSGLLHDVTPGYSERFVLNADKGAIAFMATSSLSLTPGLNAFSTNFYREISGNSYTATLGTGMKNALTNVYKTSTDNFVRMVAYEMTLHGDPGITLNQYPKPDYAIDSSSLFFNPSTITPGLDSFEVKLVVTNLGKAFKDTTIAVTLTRTVFDPSGVAIPSYFKQLVKAPYYRDTVTFKMAAKVGTDGYGLNYFEPYVDADFNIDEMAEGNNGNFRVTANIQQDDVIPIYPYEFAIVPKLGVTLKASTVNPFAPARNYKFQIDTTELFNSPLLQTQIVNQTGGVLHWTPTSNYTKDSTVFYWRVAIDSTNPNWHYSSFIYINGEYPGWNQSHYYQYKKDDSLNLKLDADRVFKFPNTVNAVHVLTGYADAVGGNLPYASLAWDYNTNNMYRYRMGSCGFVDGITFGVINNVTGEPWESQNIPSLDDWGDQFGNYHCKTTANRQYGFDFPITGTHPTYSGSASGLSWSVTIKNFLDAIPNGYYILMYSTNRPNYSLMDGTLVTALQGIGFNKADSLQQGLLNGPFIFFTQKGNSGVYYYNSSGNFNVPVEANITFNGSWYQGQWLSPKIGPAVEWGSMHWRNHALENPTKDKDSVDVIGVNSNGIETILFSTNQPDNLFTGNKTIDPNVYPYIRLRLRTQDSTLRTPTQMDYWRVLYKKPPEAAINPTAWFKFTDNISIGDSVHVEIGLENVTDIDMDSMLARFRLRDANLNSYVDDIRHSPLPGLDILHLTYAKSIDNRNYNGLNRIIIEANPDNDQPEQYHFNNFAEISFNAAGDKINPLLDVTFDGQHIFNGDIVSAKPTILITLKDENPFLALNDTGLIDVYLKYPNDATLNRIGYDNINVKFFPADSTSTNLARNNKAQIEFKPTFTIDGTYELIVKDRDRSGNNSSSNGTHFENKVFYDYKTSFEVVTKPSITNVLNYPNPFTTSTRFLFTLTGTEVPDYMKIQIMTIKGTVVREITKEEIGPMRIGKNMTEYAWDGRDQFGDLLANGVYFYRVVARLDDKQMDHRSENFDKYFKKGFGKLVIVR